jgi:Tol biopolymer transport system component
VIGTTIGPYRILDKLGAGGMGEVYRARDEKLHRDVAIKVLPVHSAADSDLLVRLNREALILASLNHPGIATVHGIEDFQGAPAIVMELVEGETLADRLARGPLPVSEALSVGRQLADALSFAHDRGVIHRDLKPANVRIRPDGAVKILDFGLAKALTSPTTPDAATVAGILRSESGPGSVLGTVAYMSPEQARGLELDRRTDIWAYGCTLYEMLTGRAPFARATRADTIAAILGEDPDWQTLPATTPAEARLVLERCLQRDPRQRLRDIADARLSPDSTAALSGRVAMPLPRRAGRRTWAIAAGGAAIAAAIAAFLLTRSQTAPSPPAASGAVRKFEVSVDGLGEMPATYAGESGPGAGVLISPDGRQIVYPREGKLWIRELSQLASRPLDGTDGAVAPAWSPDSRWLAFASGTSLRKIAIDGGAPVTLATLASAFVEAGGAAWQDDGTITFTTGNGSIWRVPAQGGDAVEVLPLGTGEQDFHDVTALPGARGALFVTHYIGNRFSIDVLAADGRRQAFGPTPVHVRHPAYSPSGHLVYQRVDRNPGIWALAVDRKTLAAEGAPFLVAGGGLRPSVAADGTLVFVTDETWGLLRLSLVDRTGAAVRDIGEPVRGLKQPAISPDGARAAAVLPGAERDDVWVYDMASGSRTRLTFDGVRGDPAWDPSGARIVYSCGATSREGGLCLKNADGSGEARLVVPGASMGWFSPDGLRLSYVLTDPATRTDVWHAPVDEPGLAALLVRTPDFDFSPRIAPDGRHLVYGSNASGRPEVYVTEFPEARSRRQISTASGAQPRWNPRGGEIFYLDPGGRLNAVELDTGAQPKGPPRMLFAESTARARLSDGFEPAPDGKQFLVIREVDRGAARPRITVVENWSAEFAASR